ncbi:protein cordon-bleu isoform X3 [Balaenoptera acutorostrata]|uniref:Protein cordon-bleu isoform X3 n=1 Tax=Balaenoptera acutorostrata TaxID=9767 RepID=A0ABM3TUT1_BALAC|nr:protein cordon-bleu isoform X3 [Balaenoptera acutorostrata]
MDAPRASAAKPPTGSEVHFLGLPTSGAKQQKNREWKKQWGLLYPLRSTTPQSSRVLWPPLCQQPCHHETAWDWAHESRGPSVWERSVPAGGMLRGRRAWCREAYEESAVQMALRSPIIPTLKSARKTHALWRRKMKARAPPPPGRPTTPSVHRGQRPPRDASPSPPRNPLGRTETLDGRVVAMTVVLPSGLEKTSVVNGSHAMMDLLVELCLQNHLNPSNHALEIRSSETQQPLNFKPNTLVGTLNAHTVFLKEKVPEAKVKAGPAKVPEKTVRLVVNYLRTQKAVVRVSPEVPLQSVLPVICAKCDVSPEHVVLLRDNVAGEELELSKSLNELGIKELYAWDNKRVLLTKTQSEPSLSCRETFRKSSLGYGETDKEKKKILGFFKVNKRSDSKGCLTTPNSPSVNPRSTTLGPSRSLGNISGVSVKSDLKKRRAPPPPSLPRAGPPVQDKTSEKVSLGSQMDLQKKKRRAPAPPPPQPPPSSPLVPPRTEDREEDRKGRTGVGRQVPQKPPRGTARGPPQLVLPPPPPYPPPDTDVAEPLGFPGEGAVSEASDLRPTLSLPLGPGGPCGVDGVPPLPSEAEETVSVGSCFASEDTTEDSGVMSSPSDIVSLDSQHDSTKSKDKWATDQEDCSDQDLAGTPEPGPQKSLLWERRGSGNWHPRNGKVAPASREDEDLFMSGQFQKTLAELDEELEEIEESYETDSSFLTNCVHSMSGRCPQGTVIPDGDTEAIPVTFIGEVLDDPVDSGAFSNRNNNAGSFDAGSTASKKAQLPPCQAEHSQQHGQRRAAGPGSPAPSQDPGREIRVASTNTWKDVTPSKMAPKATSASTLHTHDLNAKEEGKAPGSAHGGRTLGTRRVSTQAGKEKEGDDENDVWTPPPWYRGQHPGGSYGLKYGLTTYKIVPPKSEMKCYDRGASLSMGAIKIDELGNLVSPHTNAGRTMVPTAPTLEAEAPPIGKVKEFWRTNSIEKHSGRPTEGAKRTSTPTTPTNPQPQESRLRAEPTSPDPKATLPRPLSPHPEDGRPLEEGRSWPLPAAACPLKVPAANPAEVPFLKPQRRTSSQYVASAIAKRIGTLKVHTDMERKPDNAQKTCEGRAPEPTGRPPMMKDGTTPSLYPETGVRHHGDESAAGAHPGGQISSPYGKLCTQDGPTGIHRTSHGPLITAAQTGQASVGQSCGLSGKQSPRNHRTSSASDPKCQPAGTSPPPPRSGGGHTTGSALVNGSRWVSVHTEPPHSPRVSETNSHAGREPPEWEEKPGLLSTDVPEADGTLPASIFGPKKKFRPVVQRPAPKDTSLHSALMEAIHSAGGKDRLRKTPEPSSEGAPKKPSYTEADSERSALLAAIRGHSGTCSLRKVTSSASEELQSLRGAVMSARGAEPPGLEDLGIQSAPALPPAPPPPPPVTQAPTASRTASRSSAGPLSNPVDARQALMDAIRSGTGAAKLRKVPLLV